jgi:hypothetical protein
VNPLWPGAEELNNQPDESRVGIVDIMSKGGATILAAIDCQRRWKQGNFGRLNR